MLHVRPSESRGYAHHGWLESYHSFSFAGYYDPAHMGYSVLRVINDDQIAPGTGFGMHGHQDMEIVTYMLSGELRHTDSMGHSAVIRAGDVQRMSAGTGIRHSEMNASGEQSAHLLQIWIAPNQLGLPPAYEDKRIPLADKANRWALIAAGADSEATLKIHQDLSLYATVLDASQALLVSVAESRCAYLHVARGEVLIADLLLKTGDALKLDEVGAWTLMAQQQSEVLWFDLPKAGE